MPAPTLIRDERAGSSLADVPNALDRLAEAYERRSLDLSSPRHGPIDLGAVDDHVQGLARIDHPRDVTTLVCSVSGERHGTLWFGSFKRERYTTAQGAVRTRLSRHGSTVATLETALPHPGGIQAAGTWLAVAAEGGGGPPRVEIYDVRDPARPKLHDQLPLAGAGGAGWVAMAQRAESEFVLFVGGPSYARKDSWVYSYRPSDRTFRLQGTFGGQPRSSLGSSAWGPQNGGSLFVDRDDGWVYLITQGTKGTSGNDVYRERVRCFRMIRRDSGAGVIELAQEPADAPENYVIDADPHPPRLGFLFFRSPGLRWGSTFFADEHGELIMYASARNAMPANDGYHHLEIVEVRQRRR